MIIWNYKLFICDSWKNDFEVGDYVCVFGKFLWDGKLEDLDLVKFVVW